jgi:transcriptional regulator with XRE-family HTH domain
MADDEVVLSIAQAIRRVRERRGWSQRQLAAILGVQRATVSRYETQAIPLSAARVQAIALALDVDPGLLYRLTATDPAFEALRPFVTRGTPDPRRHRCSRCGLEE